MRLWNSLSIEPPNALSHQQGGILNLSDFGNADIGYQELMLAQTHRTRGSKLSVRDRLKVMTLIIRNRASEVSLVSSCRTELGCQDSLSL